MPDSDKTLIWIWLRGEYVQIRDRIEGIPMGQSRYTLKQLFLWQAKSNLAVAWFGDFDVECDNYTWFVSKTIESGC